MHLVETPWDVVSAAATFLVGMLVIVLLGRRFQATVSRSLMLYIWHTLMCIMYLWFVITYGGDSLSYYERAAAQSFGIDVGTTGVLSLTAVFARGLNMSLLGTALAYNVFGAIGLLAFDACLRIATRNKSYKVRCLATLIVFLPSVSFWSSGIGKDALSFMAVGLALWACLDLRRRTVAMIIAVAVMLLVRPHMAAMMVLALIISVLLNARSSLPKRVMQGAVATAAAALILPFALNYAGIGENARVPDVADYIEQRQGYNMEGGGGVDIASMSLPVKLYTYMFRPMLYEARSVTALAASIDNLILVFLFAVGGWHLLFKRPSGQGENRIFMWTYAMLAWLVLALVTANLGIALRQKWMFTPMLIFLLISVIGRPRRRNIVSVDVPLGSSNRGGA